MLNVFKWVICTCRGYHQLLVKIERSKVLGRLSYQHHLCMDCGKTLKPSITLLDDRPLGSDSAMYNYQ